MTAVSFHTPRPGFVVKCSKILVSEITPPTIHTIVSTEYSSLAFRNIYPNIEAKTEQIESAVVVVSSNWKSENGLLQKKKKKGKKKTNKTCQSSTDSKPGAAL